KMFEGYCGMGSPASDRYYSELPVWAEGNLYFNGAKAMPKEKAYIDTDHKVEIGFEEKDGKILLKTNLYDFIPAEKCKLIKTQDIPPAFEPEENYENPDGSPIVFDTDFLGKKRDSNPIAGPFANAKEIENPLF
ncbi:MAG: hypothetical protein K5681_03955, partial [Treponema sp.]|nr:hypothetical protein [Treponema sp.]